MGRFEWHPTVWRVPQQPQARYGHSEPYASHEAYLGRVRNELRLLPEAPTTYFRGDYDSDSSIDKGGTRKSPWGVRMRRVNRRQILNPGRAPGEKMKLRENYELSESENEGDPDANGVKQFDKLAKTRARRRKAIASTQENIDRWYTYGLAPAGDGASQDLWATWVCPNRTGDNMAALRKQFRDGDGDGGGARDEYQISDDSDDSMVSESNDNVEDRRARREGRRYCSYCFEDLYAPNMHRVI